MGNDYLSVTELSGDKVSKEQVERLCHRYFWAGEYCRGKNIMEAACGTGQGLGYLFSIAESLEAGDFSHEILSIAKKQYRDRIPLRQFDAQNMPYKGNSLDVILMFEALYYIPDADLFVKECARVLRAGGKVLIATANKDLYDFNPSPLSHEYHGVVELKKLFNKHGFDTEFFGIINVDDISLKQRILRPVKKLIVDMGLMPKTTAGKKWMKRLVFGGLVKMPREIDENTCHYIKPYKISSNKPDYQFKVVYCVATLGDESF